MASTPTHAAASSLASSFRSMLGSSLLAGAAAWLG
jgi:hypothetical protein